MSDSSMRIPRFPQPVKLRQLEGEPMDLSVFLSSEPFTDRELVREVVELLSREEPFFPAQDTDKNKYLLINRNNLCWIRVPRRETDKSIQETELFVSKASATITIVDSTQLEGELNYNLPPENSRPVDYLNSSAPFLKLYGDEHIWLVNKQYIDHVTHE